MNQFERHTPPISSLRGTTSCIPRNEASFRLFSPVLERLKRSKTFHFTLTVIRNFAESSLRNRQNESECAQIIAQVRSVQQQLRK
jgi:hypothetical protein